MGAHPKRRISTARKGKRRKDQRIDEKQVQHHPIPFHKRGLIEQIKKMFGTK